MYHALGCRSITTESGNFLFSLLLAPKMKIVPAAAGQSQLHIDIFTFKMTPAARNSVSLWQIDHDNFYSALISTESISRRLFAAFDRIYEELRIIYAPQM